MELTALLFSNGYDENLQELTRNRTLGSLPILGQYRIIDFVLSNLANSQVEEVGVITRQNYQSLLEHLGTGQAWGYGVKGRTLTVLPPFGSKNAIVYKGKMEALYGALRYLKHSQAEYVLLSDSNLVFSLDYRHMLECHRTSKADITILAHKGSLRQNSPHHQNLVLEADRNGQVTQVLINCFSEGEGYVGLNTYLLKRELLIRLTEQAHIDCTISFERNVLAEQFGALRCQLFELKGYAAMVDSVQEYLGCSMDFLSPEIQRQIFRPDWPVYTSIRPGVPVLYDPNCTVSNSLIADSCKIQGNVFNSILFQGVTVEKGATIKNSVVMKNSRVGENAVLEFCIIDKDSNIGNSKLLMGVDRFPVVIKKGSMV
ncbi:MAG TPA: glucose-1-phosphate adenylyltransferase subunit GlgD [Candidatus Egerieicola pullicola]|uniref:Glucose-1-phosphate adenylyltransferase subunit GlgD n=1 Tax=Candidatus Egerieicola pullicola TaxID=2840775 RepID=A0A9D1AJB5_9FIRM|nr:glucose-1-phosphate adenylyltransferase subunit GlgD [Candidatus Egerieicola pullicola]